MYFFCSPRRNFRPISLVSLSTDCKLTNLSVGNSSSGTPSLGNDPQSCPTAYKLMTDSPMISANPCNLNVE